MKSDRATEVLTYDLPSTSGMESRHGEVCNGAALPVAGGTCLGSWGHSLGVSGMQEGVVDIPYQGPHPPSPTSSSSPSPMPISPFSFIPSLIPIVSMLSVVSIVSVQ